MRALAAEAQELGIYWAYEVVLRGRPVDIESIVDGALLVDLWTDLVLPRRLRAAWQSIIDEAVGRDG